MAGIDDLLAQAQRPRITVALCLRGDLFAERARVVEQVATHQDASLGDTRGVELRARLAMLDDAMKTATSEFTFQALPRNEYRTLRDSYAQDKNQGEQIDREFLDALVAASLVVPELTGEETSRLLDALSEGQAATLEDAAWGVNQDTDAVPLLSSG